MLYKLTLSYSVVLEWVFVDKDDTNSCSATAFSRYMFAKFIPVHMGRKK